ncbi:MAG: DNA-processing protein DprA [Oscillospiraceae bacterium]|nr:DNA-processing protein DprA [Oscillospiraceae bacterium]
MRAAERGFLLLSSHLGDPARKPLTVPQLRTLLRRMQSMDNPEPDRELDAADLTALGYASDLAAHILKLLSEDALLDHYLKRAEQVHCVPLTRISAGYPLLLRKRLGLDSPGCLWVKGDGSLLAQPAVSLVGSRDLLEENRSFAEEVGRQAALQGYVLVSGNARGADRAAQESCLAAGGQVISVVADELCRQKMRENVLYVSEDGFSEAFSSIRAHSRNRVIHALGLKTFVAQSTLQTGGTWSGTVKNLQNHWSDVYCFRDGSAAMLQLEQMGAALVGMDDLGSFYDLPKTENLFDR